MNKILHGDSLEILKTLETESVDSIVTDPPYGYSFMGKDWDKAVPPVGLWKECLRVLKSGGFAFVMSAPRSDVQMHMIRNLEDAGFNIGFTPLYHTYASGFPKAMNIGKMVDKRMGMEREITQPETEKYHAEGNTPFDMRSSSRERRDVAVSEEAKALDGSYGGFQPKPAVEVIIVAMKPLSEKTFIDQALKNGKGITWLDDCRIPAEVGFNYNNNQHFVKDGINAKEDGRTNVRVSMNTSQSHEGGRFPSNLLVSDDILNDGRERKSGKVKPYKENHTNATSFHFKRQKTFQKDADTGSYSRYFDFDAWANTIPFLIFPKASKREKNEGLGKLKASHPTCKPLKLMSYLIILGSREGDLILDPFVGSGTTCVAAKKLNRNCIGIEREEEYVKIANARINAVQNTLFTTHNNP